MTLMHKILIGASVVAVAAIIGLWPRERDIKSYFDQISDFPYPDSLFMDNLVVWAELGLDPDQAGFIRNNEHLKRTNQEIAQFGVGQNLFVDRILRARRTETKLTPAQRKRYSELKLQMADTLALRDPKVAEQLGLSELQKRQISGAQAGFDRARRMRKELNDHVRKTYNDLWNSGIDGKLATEIIAEPKIVNWVDYNERIYIRELLNNEQRRKLHQMMGKPAPLDNLGYNSYTVLFNAGQIVKILRDRQFQQKNGIDGDIALQLSQPRDKRTSVKLGEMQFHDRLILDIWPKLNEAQKTAIVLETIALSKNTAVCLRRDISTLLGMSDQERDRLTLRRHLDWASRGVEGQVMGRRWTRLESSNRSSHDSTDLTLISRYEKTVTYDTDAASALWAGMSTPVRKKWLELGGKEPKVKPVDD